MIESEEQVRNVLIAEDDDEDFELFSEVIQNLSLKVFLARAPNGDVLMKILHQEVPDMLFLDILMPCKNGKDCLHEIRAHKKFDELPIIVYSSVRDLETIEFCYRKGTNLFVYKPHTYAELVQTIERIFSMNWKKVRYYPTRSNFVFNPSMLSS
jgi:response regulator RpfG family c-di-GMP phosphodiesterase